jgi:hypothetical protein
VPAHQARSGRRLTACLAWCVPILDDRSQVVTDQIDPVSGNTSPECPQYDGQRLFVDAVVGSTRPNRPSHALVTVRRMRIPSSAKISAGSISQKRKTQEVEWTMDRCGYERIEILWQGNRWPMSGRRARRAGGRPPKC